MTGICAEGSVIFHAVSIMISWIRTGLMDRFPVIILAVCGLWGTPLQAAVYGDLEVTALPQPAVEGGSKSVTLRGYVEIRVAIRNRSSREDHQVQLRYPPRSSSSTGSHLGRATRTVFSTHGTSQVVSLFLPPLDSYSRELGVEIDGTEQGETLSCTNRERGYTMGARPTLNLLVSRGIPQDWKDQVRTENAGEVQFQRSELPLAEWSSNWLGYTSFDIVVLTRQESESIPADVRNALKRYLTAGGMLMIYQPSSDSAGQSVPESLIDPSQPTPVNGAYAVGLGQVLSIPPEGAWPVSLWDDRLRSEQLPLDPDIRISREARVPVQGILALVILFALAIGPFNVWYLTRRKKKMWLWWNVPAVSLATCLVIFVYSLLAEGISGHARNVAFTLLDERTHLATTLGYCSYYCPLTPSDGLHFSTETEVIPLTSDNDGTWTASNSGRLKTIDWTKDQHLESNWIASRIPVCLGVRKSEIRRERLSFQTDSSGTLSVVNGLGADLESLLYLDSSGRQYQCGQIPMGQQVTLKHSPTATSPAGPQVLRELSLQGWDQLLLELRQNPERALRPGTYLAVLKKSPFLEDSLTGVPTTGDFGVVYGVTAGDTDGR